MIAAILLSFLCVMAGCDKQTVTSVTSDKAQSAFHAETMDFDVPYSDLVNDGGEIGWYRPIGDDDFSTELTKHGSSTDKQLITSISDLINIEQCKAEGHIAYDEYEAIAASVNHYPPVMLQFDHLNSVLIYPNNVIVTSTFYTSGETYDALAEKYYQEHGIYPDAVTEGYEKFIAPDNTFKDVSDILLGL